MNMNLTGKTLVQWLEQAPKESFPASYDYAVRFKALGEYMDKHIHPVVTPMASLVDGGLLTDHGPEHVKTVIKRATELLRVSDADLTPYEVYVLLVAIHMHDAGNSLGRRNHELNNEQLIKSLGPMISDETLEQRIIWKIAQAHGGTIAGDKDKISKLPVKETVLGQEIRSRLLAGLLRFADELADDRFRASRFMITSNAVPTEAEVFHKYAYALHSVRIEENRILLDFELTVSDVMRKFGKDKAQVYLIDEIYDRTMKMHRERMYCMRFMRPSISVDQIEVAVTVFGRHFGQEILLIAYRLEEQGYPDEKNPSIFVLCPNLNKHEYGNPVDGSALEEYSRKNRLDEE